MTQLVEQRLLFRCNGGQVPEFGTGHIRRCLWLAEYLRERRGAVVHFLVRGTPDAVDRVSSRGFHVQAIPGDAAERTALEEALRLFQPHICVFDCLATDPEVLALCRAAGAVIVSLDDLGAGLEQADIVINGILEHRDAYYRGPKYVVLPEFTVPRPMKDVRRGEPTVLLSFGGYDHGGLAERVLEAVGDLSGVGRFVVIGGSDARRSSEPLAGPHARVERLTDVHNFPELMADADVALVAGGLTLFEAMRCGVPSITVAQYDHQLETARRYERLGATISAGRADESLGNRVRQALEPLLACPERRESMAAAGRRLVDGQGLERVADLITVCQPLTWDTGFFGFKIGTLHVQRLTEAIVRHGLDMSRAWNLDCLYYLSDCHHAPSVRLAEQHGFHFVDIRLTFECATSGIAPAEPIPGIDVRPAIPSDVPVLQEIARDSYIDSRYYFDQGFPPERCEAFYSEWIKKSCDGYADQVLVAYEDNRPLGYVTCQLRPTPSVADIELVGLHRDARGRGVGRFLIERTLQWFQSQGVETVEVVTQGRNYAAQRLYQRCGFVTQKTQLWYHRWFTSQPPGGGDAIV